MVEKEAVKEQSLEDAPPVNIDMPDDVLAGEKEPEVKEKEVHTPPEGGERWNEMYGRGKAAERKIGELEKQIADSDSNFSELKEHNKKLAATLDQIHDTVLDENAPDPTTDPEGYATYMTKKAELVAERKFNTLKEEEASRVAVEKAKTDAEKSASETQASDEQVANLKAQISTMNTMYKDYNTLVTTELTEEIKANPALYERVWGSPNPPAEAYKYATEKVTKATQLKDQAHVETGSPSGGENKGEVVLSLAQKKMAFNLGISEKKYAAQVVILNKRKGK